MRFCCEFHISLAISNPPLPSRGYGDASVPPTITLEGKDLGGEEEEQWSRWDLLRQGQHLRQEQGQHLGQRQGQLLEFDSRTKATSQTKVKSRRFPGPAQSRGFTPLDTHSLQARWSCGGGGVAVGGNHGDNLGGGVGLLILAKMEMMSLSSQIEPKLSRCDVCPSCQRWVSITQSFGRYPHSILFSSALAW